MVIVRIPAALRRFTAEKEEVAVEATNVQELINALDRKCPGIKSRICDDAGNVRRFVNLFRNSTDIRTEQNLDTPLHAGDEVSIIPAIAGGV